MTLRETLERVYGMDVPTNEQATITQIIVPILIDLGWDVSTISREHWMGGRKEGGKVDIALMKDKRCVCIVEAKRPGVNLIDYVDQVLRYAFYEGVTVCVLTDGLEWRFYLPREEGKPEEREFYMLRLKDNLVEQSENDLKRFLSCEAILSGAAKHDAVRELNKLQIDRELPGIWREMLTEPDQELVTWVRKRISEKHGFSPSADQVAKIIVAMAASSQSTYSSKQAISEVRIREVDKRPTGYTLFGVYKPWQYGVDMWIDVVEQVYSRHEHDFLEMTKEHLRLWPRSNRILISECPLDISGRPLNENRDWRKQWRKIKYTNYPEIFVYKDMKIIWFIEVARKLLELFEYPASDLEIHEE